MLTLTRDIQLRSTRSGRIVATISLASDHRDRDAQSAYLRPDRLAGRCHCRRRAPRQGPRDQLLRTLEPREYLTSSGDQRVALELHGAEIEYRPKPRRGQPTEPARSGTDEAELGDIPF